jgi:thermitase
MSIHVRLGVLCTLLLVVVLAWPIGVLADLPGGGPERGVVYASGRILVKFRPGVTATQRTTLCLAEGGHVLDTSPQIGASVVSVPVGAEEAMAARFARLPGVEYAEPDHLGHALDGPSEPGFSFQWGLHNVAQVFKTGVAAGTADADIDAPEAWQLGPSGAGVIIAILDSGIDQDNAELAPKLVVDKANYSNSATFDDLHGHGTAVSGVAAAPDNGAGTIGVAPGARLMNVKVLNDSGVGLASWAASGILFAADHGAKVINLSIGFDQRS